jgi:uridylate kinase
MSDLKYRRILLKMSGESLLGDSEFGINTVALDQAAEQIIQTRKTGVQLAIVIGGGNIFRGMKAAASSGMDRSVADSMGMLATVMNALALQDALERKNIKTRVMTAIPLSVFAEPYIRRRALHHLDKDRVLILAAGTGHPFFTTDTAAALRAAELHCNVIFKATTVDGVYDKDPKLHSDAVRFDKLDYSTFLNRDLGVMDAAAVSLCRSNKIPILVFDLSETANIIGALHGQNIGTLIGEE